MILQNPVNVKRSIVKAIYHRNFVDELFLIQFVNIKRFTYNMKHDII